MLNYLGMPIQASTHAAQVDDMIAVVHWLMLVLFVGWGTFYLFVLFRFRKGANPKANYVGAKGKFAKGSEILIVVAEMVLLFWYAIPGWTTRVAAFPSENEAVVVRVIAQQFQWNIHYPGPDGKFGRSKVELVSAENNTGIDRSDPDAKDDIITINQMTLPVNLKILVQLSTLDVIHSFGLVEMRVKQDAIPGFVMPVWFEPNRIGDYELACSQLCGLGHFRMRGFVNVKTDDEFKAFLAEEAKSLTQ